MQCVKMVTSFFTQDFEDKINKVLAQENRLGWELQSIVFPSKMGRDAGFSYAFLIFKKEVPRIKSAYMLKKEASHATGKG